MEQTKRIPLKFNDRIGSSTKNWNKIEVTLKNDCKNLFQISGEFPTFISAVDQTKLANVDIKIGDNIISINQQNVSRASAKSVRKIIKTSNVIQMVLSRPDLESLNKLLSSNSTENKPKKFNLFSLFKSSNKISSSDKSLLTTCIGFNFTKQSKQFSNKQNVYIESPKPEIVEQEQDQSDCGYYSIPSAKTVASTFSSTSDLGSSASSESSSIDEFKSEINQFLNNIQQAIDHYVRPSIMFKILCIDESLILYQNIEKLIPVTKFLHNIINTLDLNSNKTPSADLIKIVFDSFKIYLNGLPKAISLLGDLTCSNDSFVKFIENLGESCSFKIMDFLFMPLKFVQSTVDFLNVLKTQHTEMNNLNDLINDLFECVMSTYAILEEDLEEPKDPNSITTVSDCSDFYSLSSHETENVESIQIQIKNDSKNDQWNDASLSLEKFKITFDHFEQEINLSQMQNIKQSKQSCVIFIQILDEESKPNYYALKFENDYQKTLAFNKFSTYTETVNN